MREAGPLHYITESPFGPYWAVVGHKAIQHIEALPDTFSSSWEHGGITILNRLTDEELAEAGIEERRELPMFIAMDRPQHTGQRRTVAPKFTPSGMAEMEGEIRQRTGELLDSLPRGEVFDLVDKVSLELTTGMLAILFGFPWEDRRLLTFCPIGRAIPNSPPCAISTRCAGASSTRWRPISSRCGSSARMTRNRATISSR